MRNSANKLARTIAAGMAGAALSASLAAPAQAAEVIQLPADLWIESVVVTQVSNNQWKVKATLRNGAAPGGGFQLPRKAYPGGGNLVLRRSTGGMKPVPPPYLFASQPVPAVLMAQKPIPALGNGQAIDLEVTTSARALFTASAEEAPSLPDDVEIASAPSHGAASIAALPEVNTANNTKSASNMTPRIFNVDTLQVQTYLNDLLSQFQIHLNKSGSYAKLPGYYQSNWNIADATMPFVGKTAHWAVKDINYQGGQVSIAQQSLFITAKFETGGVELDGSVPGSFLLVPDFQASPIEVRAIMKLQYDASKQYFSAQDPQVTVNAKLAGLPSGWSWLQTDFNNKLANAVRDLFGHEDIKQKISFELNDGIYKEFLTKGRIVTVSPNHSYLRLYAEVGS